MQTEFLRGFRAAAPVSLSVAAYGAVLGVLASQKGFGWAGMMFMNAAVFAGSAQFVMVDMWSARPPILEMGLAVLVINMRYLLIGASLAPLLSRLGLRKKMAMMHMVTDENWAVTMAEQRRGLATPMFLLGGGVCVFMAWSGGTLAGLLGGGAIVRPEDYALDFAFTAVFLALAVGLFQGRKDVLPWLAAGVLALAAEKLLPGRWYIVIGGLGGAITAMLAPDKDRRSSGGRGAAAGEDDHVRV